MSGRGLILAGFFFWDEECMLRRRAAAASLDVVPPAGLIVGFFAAGALYRSGGIRLRPPFRPAGGLLGEVLSAGTSSSGGPSSDFVSPPSPVSSLSVGTSSSGGAVVGLCDPFASSFSFGVGERVLVAAVVFVLAGWWFDQGFRIRGHGNYRERFLGGFLVV